MIRSARRCLTLLIGLWSTVQTISAWETDDPVFKHGLRVAPLRLLPRFYAYSDRFEWPKEVEEACSVVRENRLHQTVYDKPMNPVNEFLWTKIQYMVNVRVDKSEAFNPKNHSIYFVFIVTLSKNNIMFVIFDLTANTVKAGSLDERKHDSTEWNKAYYAVHEQSNKVNIGPIYPPQINVTFNVSFGVFVGVDHDATYEALYTCYREIAKFSRAPHTTYCEKFHEISKFPRLPVPESINVTYIFLPGQEWRDCTDPYCDTAKLYTEAEPMIGCTFYKRDSYQWKCKAKQCTGAKFDRPFETAQRLAMGFRTQSDGKPYEG